MTIQGHIGIQAEEGTTLNLYSRVLIEDATIEEGGKIVASENNLKKVVVAPKAELELIDATGSTKQAEIINAGTLTLSTGDFVRVDNHGVLKVNCDLENAKGINVEYLDCVDNKEIISMPIDLNPSVEVMPGGVYALTSKTLNYPITVDAKTSDEEAGQLMLKRNVKVVKNVITLENGKEIEKEGSITNNGVISTKKGTDAQLTIAAGRTMTVGTGAEVEGKVIIEPASHKLVDMTDGVTGYKPAAQVINNGTLNNVEVNGLLVMGNANARVKGAVTYEAENADKGEINNTAKGVIEKTISGTDVVVFATVNEINLDDHANTVKALKDYTTATRQVSVFRLIGEMKRVQKNE